MHRGRMSRRELLAAGVASALTLSGPDVWAQSALPPVPDDTLVPFTFRASDAALADLRRRLDLVRWPERETANGWEQGPPLAAMRGLVDYWRSGYDWRTCEAELNRWPHFTTRLDGLGIHFIHVRSRHQDALPI